MASLCCFLSNCHHFKFKTNKFKFDWKTKAPHGVGSAPQPWDTSPCRKTLHVLAPKKVNWEFRLAFTLQNLLHLPAKQLFLKRGSWTCFCSLIRKEIQDDGSSAKARKVLPFSNDKLYCIHIIHTSTAPSQFSNQTSKEVRHVGMESVARTPTANVRNGLRFESHHVSKSLRCCQARQRIKAILATPQLANQTSKEVRHVGMESLARTPTANVRNGLRFESHHVSKSLRCCQARQRIKAILATPQLANQTSKEVRHAGMESLARTPTANVRNGLRFESHHVSKSLRCCQARQRNKAILATPQLANQTSKEVRHAGMESLARTPTANVRNGLRFESHHASKSLRCCHARQWIKAILATPQLANQTSKEVRHVGMESLARTPTANVRNGLRFESHHASKSLRCSQARQRIKAILATPQLANQTSKEVRHAGMESLARTPTANVRNGLRFESHHASKSLRCCHARQQIKAILATP